MNTIRLRYGYGVFVIFAPFTKCSVKLILRVHHESKKGRHHKRTLAHILTKYGPIFNFFTGSSVRFFGKYPAMVHSVSVGNLQ